MPTKVAAGFAAAVGAIVISVVVFFGVVTERQEAAARFAETSDTLLALERLGALLWEAESAQRGYLLTKDPRYLEPYERAVGEIRVALAEVETRVADDPADGGRTARLDALVQARLSELRRALEARDAHGLAEALRIAEGGQGSRLAGRIAALHDELEGNERATLGGRQRAWFGSIAAADAVFVGAHVLLLVLLAAAAMAVRNEMQAREEHQRERERMLELQERLLAVVGHDLRNPLSAIEAGVTLLSRAELAAPEARTAARVLSSSRRMARMVRDLLDWTRVRTGGGIPVSRQAADLGEICRGVLDEIALRPGGPRVELSAEGDLSGRWDSDRLEQAFGNLIANGMRYAPADRPVRVRATAEPDRVRVEFENDGPPIPPEVMRSMFDPFRRGGGAGEGLGLGLFIVQSIIEAHGGTVEVDSGPGRPVRFTVILPRERRSRRTPVPGTRRAAGPGQRTHSPSSH
jgi:signal transduction histidine kinase